MEGSNFIRQGKSPLPPRRIKSGINRNGNVSLYKKIAVCKFCTSNRLFCPALSNGLYLVSIGFNTHETLLGMNKMTFSTFSASLDCSGFSHCGRHSQTVFHFVTNWKLLIGIRQRDVWEKDTKKLSPPTL